MKRGQIFIRRRPGLARTPAAEIYAANGAFIVTASNPPDTFPRMLIGPATWAVPRPKWAERRGSRRDYIFDRPRWCSDRNEWAPIWPTLESRAGEEESRPRSGSIPAGSISACERGSAQTGSGRFASRTGPTITGCVRESIALGFAKSHGVPAGYTEHGPSTSLSPRSGDSGQEDSTMPAVQITRIS